MFQSKVESKIYLMGDFDEPESLSRFRQSLTPEKQREMAEIERKMHYELRPSLGDRITDLIHFVRPLLFKLRRTLP
jgi:hypothetical protein